MTAFDGLAKNQKIRATLHRDIRSICSETCHFLDLDITKPAMEVIAEMVFKKLSVYGLDLEAFAKHAKRATINSEDVKLLVRRNPSLKTHLNSIAPALGSAAKEKRRKTVALPVSKLSETPAKATDDGNQDTRAKEDPKATEDARAKEDLIAKEDARAKEEARRKEHAKETTSAEFEDMIIDDTIDLTFD